MQVSLRVHIIPIGNDQEERIFKPVEILNADRVYLITMRGEDIFKDKFNLIKKGLIAKNLIRKNELKEIFCNLYDFYDLIQTFGKIIKNELKERNKVFFNISTGGKLISTAGILACIIFGATPYYCKKDYKKNVIPENPEIIWFPKFHFQKPEKDLIKFLIKMDNYIKSRMINKISKKECIEILREIHPEIKISERTSGPYNKLKYKYLDKLKNLKYINIEQKARGKIEITKEGDLAMKIYSIDYDLNKE